MKDICTGLQSFMPKTVKLISVPPYATILHSGLRTAILRKVRSSLKRRSEPSFRLSRKSFMRLQR